MDLSIKRYENHPAIKQSKAMAIMGLSLLQMTSHAELTPPQADISEHNLNCKCIFKKKTMPSALLL